MFESFFSSDSTIEFMCLPEDFDVIPHPYPSKKFIPDWFKHLPMKIDNSKELRQWTVKRCVPFLDAMSVGYIIPLAADIEFQTNEDASGVTWFSKFNKVMIETHSKSQITTSKSPNPREHLPPLKFINHWIIKTPPGWSTLFIPPVNRPDPRFQCLSGVVDTDNYPNNINFPFFFTQPNFTGILESGTPLVQAIPFKRTKIKHKTRIATEKEIYTSNKIRAKLYNQEGVYKDEMAVKK